VGQTAPVSHRPDAGGGSPASSRRGTWAIIAGGGTGGHVMPALAIARALVAGGRDAGSIHFVGARRGIEGQVVPEAGFGITLLPGRGIARRLTLANVGAAAGIVAAVVRAFGVVARRKPAVVVSVGGFASVPCALAAGVLRVPLVLIGLDAVPGAALRLVARFAAASAVAFEGTPLPNATVTGSPIRPEILAVDRTGDGQATARARLGLPGGRTTIGVMTGSLGARRVNDAVVGLAQQWQDRDDVAIRHVTGRRDFDSIVTASKDLDGALVYQPVEFEEHMDLLYAAADVMICRGGASTAAELTAVGVPSVIVPLPGSPGDHQTANARALERAGAAVMVPDAEVTGDRLRDELGALIAAPGRLAAMADAASGLGRRDASTRIAAIVEAHARGGKGQGR
jgi:UDP-N-acetylglucosamine--N-acetylmuramyl-(pentapeptide) pyrophosphoryl-undecaprenol N-acetylglucosamine transferase